MMTTARRTAGCLSPNSRILLLTVILLLAFIHASSTEQSRETVHDDPFVAYPYRLSSTSPFGRIPDSALPGSRVPVDSSLPHFDLSQTTRYLTLQLTHNQFYLAETNTSSPNNSSDSSTMKKVALASKTELVQHFNRSKAPEKPSKLRPPGGAPLPERVRIDITGEQGNVAMVNEKMAFTLDENLHIVVENSHTFRDVDGIEFWVVAVQQEKGRPDRVVSNPFSFVVKIDHSRPEGQGAPVYAGIVVLVVCLFALLIPLTVRTKRRLREGKPLCVCGSSAKKLEERMAGKEAETGTGSDTGPGKTSGSTQAHDNLALILEGRQRADTVGKPGETLQSKNMSMSAPHFQPRWLDPHYNDVYDRPVLKTPSPSPSTRVSFTYELADPSTSVAEVREMRL